MLERFNGDDAKLALCAFVAGVVLLCCPILAYADGVDPMEAAPDSAMEPAGLVEEFASSSLESVESIDQAESAQDTIFSGDPADSQTNAPNSLMLSVSHDALHIGRPVVFRLTASEGGSGLTYALTRICRVVDGVVDEANPLLCPTSPTYSPDSVIDFSFEASGTYQLTFAVRDTDAEAEAQCIVVISAETQAFDDAVADERAPSEAPSTGAESAEQPGSWLDRGGVVYYVYNSGAFAKYQTKIGDKTYYFRSNGAMVRGKFVDGKFYGSDGAMYADRFFEHDGATYYAVANGACARYQNVIGDKTYYFRSNGAMVRNKIVAGRYYGPDGTMRANGFFKLGGTTYYARLDGALAKYKTKIGEKIYYFRSNGTMVSGKFVGDGFYGSDGILYMNRFFDHKGTTYYATASGAYARYQNIINNKVYYFWSNGSLVRDRIVDKKIYAADGHMLKQSFYDIKGIRYYALANGQYATYAQTINGNGYYFWSNGSMVRNRLIDRKIYGPEGRLLKNAFWSKSGNTYYATADGTYAVYAQTINKKKYYFWSSGIMVRNRMLLDHYYQNDGTMAIFCWVANDRYWVDADGLWIPDMPAKVGWQNPAGYYQVSSKSMRMPAGYYATPSRINPYSTRDECISAFIARAWDYIGTPYVWNYSNAPGIGVDCIGLVYQCAYACGMDLGEFNPYNHWITGPNGWHSHDANNMWNYGSIQRLSLGARQRGDLIFWHGHVAIYIGNDRIIEAYPGVVRVTSLWAHSTPIGVGRLFL